MISGRSSGQKSASVNRSSGRFALIVVAFVVVLGGLVWLVALSNKEPDGGTANEDRGRKIKEATPSLASAAQESVEQEVAEEKPTKSKSLTVNGRTHPDFIPIGIQRMRKKVHNVRTNNVARMGPQPFSNATEQVLVQIFMRDLGDPPPPETMLNLPERERKNLIGLLVSKTEITDDDSEELAVGKEILQEAKVEMLRYLKDGGTADEFLQFYYDKLEKAYEERKTANVLLMKTVREEPEIAVEFAEKINEGLRAKGIKEIALPPQFLKRIEGE